MRKLTLCLVPSIRLGGSVQELEEQQKADHFIGLIPTVFEKSFTLQHGKKHGRTWTNLLLNSLLPCTGSVVKPCCRVHGAFKSCDILYLHLNQYYRSPAVLPLGRRGNAVRLCEGEAEEFIFSVSHFCFSVIFSVFASLLQQRQCHSARVSRNLTELMPCEATLEIHSHCPKSEHRQHRGFN